MSAKTVLVVLLSFVWALNLYGQTLEEAKKVLTKVKNIEQLSELQKKYPDWYVSKDITMISDSINFPEIVNSSIGDIVLKQYNSNAPRFVMKILKVEDEELCKVKYIYLDGAIYSQSEIDSLRTLIISRYIDGEDFEVLVKEYTMDSNSTGDLGWFYKGMMVEQFDSAVRDRAKGEIFTVDVIENNWFYVVLKNHDNKRGKAIKSIKIRCEK